MANDPWRFWSKADSQLAAQEHALASESDFNRQQSNELANE
jgi:hypothetical protein